MRIMVAAALLLATAGCGQAPPPQGETVVVETPAAAQNTTGGAETANITGPARPGAIPPATPADPPPSDAATPAALAEADIVAQPQGVSRPIDRDYDALPGVAPMPPGAAPAGSCAAEIGVRDATELARQCRMVSPATRPPCNPANSCTMIRDEIARGCAMLDGDLRPASCDQQPPR